MAIDSKSQEKPTTTTPPEKTQEKPADPKKIKITAISLAPPGHWRGNHYWQAGTPTVAEVTEAQAETIRKDKRLQVLEGDVRNTISEAAVLKSIADGNSEERILREAERIIAARRSREASVIRRRDR